MGGSNDLQQPPPVSLSSPPPSLFFFWQAIVIIVKVRVRHSMCVLHARQRYRLWIFGIMCTATHTSRRTSGRSSFIFRSTVRPFDGRDTHRMMWIDRPRFLFQKRDRFFFSSFSPVVLTRENQNNRNGKKKRTFFFDEKQNFPTIRRWGPLRGTNDFFSVYKRHTDTQNTDG